MGQHSYWCYWVDFGWLRSDSSLFGLILGFFLVVLVGGGFVFVMASRLYLWWWWWSLPMCGNAGFINFIFLFFVFLIT